MYSVNLKRIKILTKVNPKELLFSHYQIEEYETPSVFEDFDFTTEGYSEISYGTLV